MNTLDTALEERNPNLAFGYIVHVFVHLLECLSIMHRGL